MLISKKESESLKRLNDSKTFMEHLYDADDVYKNIEEYNRIKESKILIEFDDMIANMLINEKVSPTITELIIRTKRISLTFITQPYFSAPEILG